MTNATAPICYANNLTGELRAQGYTSEITRLEQAEKYGPWSLRLEVTPAGDTAEAYVFELDLDPADGDGLFADIPRLDFDFADTHVSNRRERRAQVREQLYMSLSDSESGDDFYAYGYNFMLVADALVAVMLGLTVAC